MHRIHRNDKRDHLGEYLTTLRYNYFFFVYPQILDPGAMQWILSTVYVVVKEVEVEMEVVVIQ